MYSRLLSLLAAKKSFFLCGPRGTGKSTEVEGPALETFFLQELLASNAYRHLGYTIHYWRTRAGVEVDFVLYGERGLHAFEVKLTNKVRREDFKGLQAFLADYPMAKAYLAYCGEREMSEGPIAVLPVTECVRRLPALLANH